MGQIFTHFENVVALHKVRVLLCDKLMCNTDIMAGQMNAERGSPCFTSFSLSKKKKKKSMLSLPGSLLLPWAHCGRAGLLCQRGALLRNQVSNAGCDVSLMTNGWVSFLSPSAIRQNTLDISWNGHCLPKWIWVMVTTLNGKRRPNEGNEFYGTLNYVLILLCAYVESRAKTLLST